ncbi:MAG TPA: hypothetical protein PLO88_04525, partial [Bacilli bacterium]|nr:hypothetical protein [Bacilli bacterium]
MKKKDKFTMPQEKINITIPETPSGKRKPQVHDDEIYFERVVFTNMGNNINKLPDLKSKIAKIKDTLKKFEEKGEIVWHQFYFLKLFSRARGKKAEVINLVHEFDKQVTRMRRILDDLKNKVDLFQYMEKIDDQELEDSYTKVLDLFVFLDDLSKELSSFQNKYFKKMKMTSYSICNDKNYQELEALNRNIALLLDGFKSFAEAHDYIYYHSGELITNTIKALVHCLETSKLTNYSTTYNYYYFLSTDAVVAMKLTEWVD